MIRSRLPGPAATVALLAAASIGFTACGGGGGGGSGSSTPCPASGAVVVHSLDTLKFSPPTLSAKAGKVTVQLVNDGALAHTFQIKGVDGKAEVNGSQKSACQTFDLQTGSYTYFCGVSGHEQAGMKGTLTVS